MLQKFDHKFWTTGAPRTYNHRCRVVHASGAFMWIPQKLRQMLSHRARSTQYLAEIAAGSENQQHLINDKLTEVVAALTDISTVLRARLDAVVVGSDEQQKLLNDKLIEAIGAVTDVSKVLRTKLDAGVAGSNQQERLLNDKVSVTVAQLSDLTNALRTRLDAVVAGVDNQTRLLNGKLDAIINMKK